VLVVNPIGPSAARYYRDGESPGTWLGAGAAAIGLTGTVSLPDLERLVQGRHPDTGAELTTRHDPHRRAGWDLILAAPKSVSVLAGMAPPPRAETLAAAQQAAADDALDWLERRACWARRDGRLVAADGLLAARFDHRHSAAGDPHLHAHVVLANLARTPDGRWSALDGSSLWLHRKAFSAIYDLALRHHLEASGLRAGWELHQDGTWDVASVPRAAIEAASVREAQVRRSLGGAETTRQSRRAARALTRTDGLRPAPTNEAEETTNHWWRSVTAAGLDPARAAGISYPRPEPAGAEPSLPGAPSVLSETRALFEPTDRERPGRPTPPPADLATTVERRLVSRRSDWTSRDVVAALAASASLGVTPETAEEWVRNFSRSCLPVAGGRLTTTAAGDLDRSILDLARRAPRGVGLAAPDALDAALNRRPELDPTGRAAVRRLTGAGHGVDLLGLPEPAAGRQETYETLVAQAVILDAAREAWTASGQAVVVVSTAGGADRWAALAGLSALGRPQAPQQGSISQALPLYGVRWPGERPASVLIVDRADRLSPVALRDILDEASLVPAKVVLVRGGTLPALHTATCRGFEAIDADLGHVIPSAKPPGHLSGPGSPGAQLTTGGALTTGGSLERIASAWKGNDERYRLVGLGPAEVRELNRRAREYLRSAGRLEGPDVNLAGRAFAAGDRVIPLRREAGAPGSVGLVVGAEAGRAHHPASIVVDWAGTQRTHDSWSARHLGHAYALTPAGLRLRGGPALLLGEPAALGRQARWVELSLRAGGPEPGLTLSAGRDLGLGPVPQPGAGTPAGPDRTAEDARIPTTPDPAVSDLYPQTPSRHPPNLGGPGPGIGIG